MLNFISNFLNNKLKIKDDLDNTIDKEYTSNKKGTILYNKSDNSKPDNNKSDNNKSDNNKSDNNKSDNNKSDNNKSDNNKSDNNKSDNNKSDNNKSIELKNNLYVDKSDIKGEEYVLEQEFKEMENYLINDKEKYGHNTNKIQDFEKGVNKEIDGYVGNNSDLDNTIKNMNINEKQQSIGNTKSAKKTIIKIEKEKPYKNLWWILTEFIIGVTLIFVSVMNINNNESEYKFIKSSIDLWTNNFNGIALKFGGVIGKYAKENIDKKKNEILSDLSDIETTLNTCNKAGVNDLKHRISNIKKTLSDNSYLSYDEFIHNYEHYKTLVNAIQSSADVLCK